VLQECLADIEWALSLGFPEASRHKLHRRQAWCWAEMGQEKEAQKALDNAMEIIKKLNPSQGVHYSLSNIVTDRPTYYMCLIVYV